MANEINLVVSKPYQLLMGLSALESLDRTGTVFIVTAGFEDAADFVETLALHPTLKRAEAFHYIEAHEALRSFSSQIAGSELWVEDDRVSLYELFVGLSPSVLSVIEEGIGTYISHYWQRAQNLGAKLKAAKWFATGLATGSGLKIGGGRITSRVYCTRPALYARLNPNLSHKAVAIPGLSLFRDYFRSALSKTLTPVETETAKLVMLGWHAPSPQNVAIWAEDGTGLYLKTHPHFPETPEWAQHSKLVPSSIPAEFVIDYLRGFHSRLDVYHASSSGCLLYPFDHGADLQFHSTNRRWFSPRLEEAMRAIAA